MLFGVFCFIFTGKEIKKCSQISQHCNCYIQLKWIFVLHIIVDVPNSSFTSSPCTNFSSLMLK